MTGFIEFVRKQGVVGLAIGFILGGAVTGLVTAFVQDIINPLITPLLGIAGNINTYAIPFFGGKIALGHFIGTLINFIVMASVVYFGFKGLTVRTAKYFERELPLSGQLRPLLMLWTGLHFFLRLAFDARDRGRVNPGLAFQQALFLALFDGDDQHVIPVV